MPGIPKKTAPGAAVPPLCGTEGDSQGGLGQDTNPQLLKDPKDTNSEEFCLPKYPWACGKPSAEP